MEMQTRRGSDDRQQGERGAMRAESVSCTRLASIKYKLDAGSTPPVGPESPSMASAEAVRIGRSGQCALAAPPAHPAQASSYREPPPIIAPMPP